MARKKLTNLLLYRRRVVLAYIFIFCALILLLTVGLSIPGGLTSAEEASSVTSVHLHSVTINLPYYLLQKASISLLGLSVLSIKLPSIVLAFISGAGIFFLLKRWLSLAISVFASLIIFASTTFLSLAGTGTPAIMYELFPVLLLLFGTRVLAHDRGIIIYSVLLLMTIAAALLTPTMIYLVLLALGLVLFNPHVRYGFRRLPVIGLLPLICGFIITAAPLAYMAVGNPDSLRQIFAIPSSLSGIIENGRVLISLFGNFIHPGIAAGILSPIIGLATAGLALLGLYRIARGIYTARAQFIVGWSFIALILAIINPGYGILLYLPLVLLSSIGLGQLASIWYRTFPLNPYARVSALVPISILIIGIVCGSSLRYVNSTLYATGSAALYSHDFQLIQDYLTREKPTNVTLAVASADVGFYENLHNSSLKHVLAIESLNTTHIGGTIIASGPIAISSDPIRILTDSRANSADRFYVYQ